MVCVVKAITLEGLLDGCQPDAELVDDLASAVARKKTKGIVNPFVSVV